jgi:hypothetical protein
MDPEYVRFVGRDLRCVGVRDIGIEIMLNRAVQVPLAAGGVVFYEVNSQIVVVGS